MTSCSLHQAEGEYSVGSSCVPCGRQTLSGGLRSFSGISGLRINGELSSSEELPREILEGRAFQLMLIPYVNEEEDDGKA